MELKYQITIDDLIAFNMHAISHSPTIKRAYRRSFLWVGIAVLLFLVATGRYQPAPLLLAVVLGLSAYAFWLRFARPRRIARQVRRLISEGQNKTVLTQHVLRVDHNGLVDSTAEGEATATWAAVERVAEDDHHIYLYVGAFLAHIVPKRAFHNEASINEFTSTLARYRAGAGV